MTKQKFNLSRCEGIRIEGKSWRNIEDIKEFIKRSIVIIDSYFILSNRRKVEMFKELAGDKLS